MAVLEFAYKPVEMFGHSGSSLNVAGGTIQVNTELFAGGTLDVRALATSTVQIQAGTLDVRQLGDSTVQAVTGTVDAAILSSINPIGGTVQIVSTSSVQIGSQPTMAGTQDVSLGN